MAMKVISLGWGVQSFTLAAMVALGELEPVDYAIHADTTHESSLTYDFAKRWAPWLEENGVKVITVVNRASELGQKAVVDIPAFTLSDRGNGQIRRQCTQDWKIAPMRRWLQKNRNGEPIEQWLGISLDEFQRMKDSDVKYITHRWPLIEMKMTRADCEKWLEAHGLEIPPRSACTFCPYHNTEEWRRIKNNPDDWREAVEVDQAIRKARPPYDLFVHPARKPLEEVDLRTETEKGQLSLWDEECEGVCGI
jgi:3'-phosphoadenosine 5'-phosphosulfate sulfotransferase (PAPS reductase)/FAD synthetase